MYAALGIVWGIGGMGITTPFYWISLLLVLSIDILSLESRKEKDN
jgi:hypothetical protein